MGSTRVVTLLLALACAGVARADDPGSSPSAQLEPALRLRLLAPLAGPRNGFFHSGLGLPLLEAAGASPEGTLSAGLRFSQTHSADTRDVDGQRSRFDGLLIEFARLRLDLAVHERLSLFTDLRVAGWDERRDVFRVYGEGSAQPVIEGEAAKLTTGRATSRHENLATASFGAAVTWWRSEDRATALGTSLLLKLPGFRRADLTSSGTGDVALTALASIGLHERLALHLNAGVVVPLGEAWIFEEPDDFDLDPCLQGALGLTWAPLDWLALGASLQGETSPWDDRVGFLDRPALTLVGGARLRVWRLTLELGGGAGFGGGSPDWTAWLELGFTSRALWGGGETGP